MLGRNLLSAERNPRHGWVFLDSQPNSRFDVEMTRQRAIVVPGQSAFAPQPLWPHGRITAQKPRQTGGGHFVLFQQKLERVQHRASRPLHSHSVMGFDERTGRFEIIHLIRRQPLFKAKQRLNGLPAGGAISGVMRRTRNVTLAKPRVILRPACEGFGFGDGSHGRFS